MCVWVRLKDDRKEGRKEGNDPNYTVRVRVVYVSKYREFPPKIYVRTWTAEGKGLLDFQYGRRGVAGGWMGEGRRCVRVTYRDMSPRSC